MPPRSTAKTMITQCTVIRSFHAQSAARRSWLAARPLAAEMQEFLSSHPSDVVLKSTIRPLFPDPRALMGDLPDRSHEANQSGLPLTAESAGALRTCSRVPVIAHIGPTGATHSLAHRPRDELQAAHMCLHKGHSSYRLESRVTTRALQEHHTAPAPLINSRHSSLEPSETSR
jgi:hypothetical protein